MAKKSKAKQVTEEEVKALAEALLEGCREPLDVFAEMFRPLPDDFAGYLDQDLRDTGDVFQCEACDVWKSCEDESDANEGVCLDCDLDSIEEPDEGDNEGDDEEGYDDDD